MIHCILTPLCFIMSHRPHYFRSTFNTITVWLQNLNNLAYCIHTYKVTVTAVMYLNAFNSIQKLYLKMVTQWVLNLSSLGSSKHVNNTTLCSYIYTKQHRFNGQTQAHTTYTFIQNISYLTYTMYIQTCTFTDNNKHVEQERTVRLSMININIVI